MLLTKNEIAYLGEAFKDTTPISLFANTTASPDGSEYETLTKKGIIQGNSYAPEALETLRLIAKPQRCTRLFYQNDFFIVEKYAYRSGEKLTLAENSNGDLLFKDGKELGGVVKSLENLLGRSSLQRSEISTSLGREELMVLLALIDLYRKDTLEGYLSLTPSREAYSLGEIQDELESGFQNGLVRLLKDRYAFPVPGSVALKPLLSGLAKKGCIAVQDGYALAEDYSILGRTFLIPDSFTFCESLQVLEDGKLAMAGGLYASAGVHDHLSFAIQEDEVELSALSSAQMLAVFEEFLKCPKLAEGAPAPKASQAPSTATWTCSCGTVNNGNFCVNCGSKRN